MTNIPDQIPSIEKGSTTYISIDKIFNYFSQYDTKQELFLSLLNLKRTLDQNSNPVYEDDVNGNSTWYLNWIGNSTAESKLEEYKGIIDIILNDNYTLYISDLQNIGVYLFLKFLNTNIYKLSSDGNTYVATTIKPLIVNSGSFFYTPLQDILHDFFLNSRGILNSYLSSYSSNLTRDQISQSKTLMKWVGCFSQNLGYKDANGNTVNFFDGKNKACDPLCYGLNKIQLVDKYGENVVCNSTICVISDISISSQNTDGSAKVKFNQVCPGCISGNGNNSCTCIIDTTIPGILNKVDGISNSDDFKQNCPNATCIRYNSLTGSLETVTCKTDDNIINTSSDKNLKTELEDFNFFGLTKYIPKKIIYLGIFMFIVLIIFFFTTKKQEYYQTKTKDKDDDSDSSSNEDNDSSLSDDDN